MKGPQWEKKTMKGEILFLGHKGDLRFIVFSTSEKPILNLELNVIRGSRLLFQDFETSYTKNLWKHKCRSYKNGEKINER